MGGGRSYYGGFVSEEFIMFVYDIASAAVFIPPFFQLAFEMGKA